MNCSDPTGHAAGRSYLAYDKGGGYFYLAPQPEQGSKYRSLLETFALDFYHRCGANPPARVIIACYKVDTPYIKKPADDLKDSLLFSAIGSFGTGKLGESLEKYIKKQLNKSISGYVGKSIGGVVGFTVPFILDSWIESAFGNDIPPGTYDLHAVTSFERYRQIDPATGQFFCWYDVVVTTYYIDMQIGQTSQWVKVEWDN